MAPLSPPCVPDPRALVSDARELQQWIDSINLAAASLSAPPLAPAVGSEPKFQRPLLPVSHTKLDLREQFLEHEKRVSKLEQELEAHLSTAPERSAARRVMAQYTEKQLYLQFEVSGCRSRVPSSSHTDRPASCCRSCVATAATPTC